MTEPDFIDMAPYAHLTLSPETERAWAAGFFDGEGWIGSHKTKDYTYLKMAVVQTKSTVTLERFNAAVGGLGRIYERQHAHPDRWARGWTLQINSIDRVVLAVNLIWPWMSQPKREQTIAAFATRAAYRAGWSAEFKLPQQRLSDDDVREIRRLFAAKVKRADIAERFKVDLSNIYRIAKRQSRANVI